MGYLPRKARHDQIVFSRKVFSREGKMETRIFNKLLEKYRGEIEYGINWHMLVCPVESKDNCLYILKLYFGECSFRWANETDGVFSCQFHYKFW